MVNWSKFFEKALKMLTVGYAGYEIHDAIDDGTNHHYQPPNQLVAMAHAKIQQAEQMEMTVSDLKFMSIMILFGVFLAIVLGIIASLYASMAKRSSRKVQREHKA